MTIQTIWFQQTLQKEDDIMVTFGIPTVFHIDV